MPVTVIWECSLLVRVGRVDLHRSVEAFFGDLFSNPAFQPFDLTAAQVYLANSERPNEDPFDALICTAASTLGLALVTRDGDIRDSGLVKVVW